MRPYPQAPVFPFRLTGMARDDSSGTPVRTAILSSATALVLARVGDIVAESYRIERVDDDAVDVVDVRDGRVIRLTFGALARAPAGPARPAPAARS